MDKKWTILLVALCLTSCTTVTPTLPPQHIAWKERQATLSHLQDWRINGKVSIQSTTETNSATLTWREQGHRYDLALFGPFGSNQLKLTGQPGLVVLQLADGKQYRASNPEQLLTARTGYHLPVSSLRYWIRGLPAPEGVSPITDFDSYGRLSHLIQQGWNIQYLSYTRMGKLELPNKIFLSSPSFRVKLIIYSWN